MKSILFRISFGRRYNIGIACENAWMPYGLLYTDSFERNESKRRMIGLLVSSFPLDPSFRACEFLLEQLLRCCGLRFLVSSSWGQAYSRMHEGNGCNLREIGNRCSGAGQKCKNRFLVVRKDNEENRCRFKRGLGLNCRFGHAILESYFT